MKARVIVVLLSLFVFTAVQFASIGNVFAESNTANVDQQLWWKKEQNKRKKDKDFPELEGGTEQSQRMQRQQPVSNIVLQQKYPETVVLQGPTTAKRIALTFDDGPDPRYTEKVLDVLKEYGVQATFFVMGSRAVAYPEIVQRMVNEGHIIGNHTYFHPNLVQEGDLATLEREVRRTEDALNEIIGYRTKLFRAPYGFLYNELVEKLAELNYSVVVWSVDSLDWQEDPAEEIAQAVIGQVEPGSIVLMHDGGDWDADRTNTIQALRQIIPTLLEQGYQFTTVSDLVNIPYQK